MANDVTEVAFNGRTAGVTAGSRSSRAGPSMTHPAAPSRTVAEWFNSGYRGLRIPRCPTCQISTSATWDQLDAEAVEDVMDVARRFRCSACGQVPAGLGVVVSDIEEVFEERPH